MSNRIRCACRRCTIRSLMGPAVVITVGLLFLLQEVKGGFYDFSNTYPVIIIVIGFTSLASALAPGDAHICAAVPPPPAPGSPSTGTSVTSVSTQAPGQ